MHSMFEERATSPESHFLLSRPCAAYLPRGDYLMDPIIPALIEERRSPANNFDMANMVTILYISIRPTICRQHRERLKRLTACI
jgi:hypothetical protein